MDASRRSWKLDQGETEYIRIIPAWRPVRLVKINKNPDEDFWMFCQNSRIHVATSYKQPDAPAIFPLPTETPKAATEFGPPLMAYQTCPRFVELKLNNITCNYIYSFNDWPVTVLSLKSKLNSSPLSRTELYSPLLMIYPQQGPQKWIDPTLNQSFVSRRGYSILRRRDYHCGGPCDIPKIEGW